jgi:hypothetical protein
MGEKRIASADFFGENDFLMGCHVVAQEGTDQARRSLTKVLLFVRSLKIAYMCSAVIWIPDLIQSRGCMLLTVDWR